MLDEKNFSPNTSPSTFDAFVEVNILPGFVSKKDDHLYYVILVNS